MTSLVKPGDAIFNSTFAHEGHVIRDGQKRTLDGGESITVDDQREEVSDKIDKGKALTPSK